MLRLGALTVAALILSVVLVVLAETFGPTAGVSVGQQDIFDVGVLVVGAVLIFGLLVVWSFVVRRRNGG